MITDDMTPEEVILWGFRPIEWPAPPDPDETPENWDPRDRAEQMTRDERRDQ